MSFFLVCILDGPICFSYPLLTCPASASQHELYRIEFLSGPGLTWDWHSTSWQVLKRGAIVPVGALLQLPAGGSLTARPVEPGTRKRRKPGSVSQAGIVVASPQPIVIRLTPELMRPRRVISGYADALDWGKFKKAAANASLNKAWQQVNALVLPGAKASGKMPEGSSESEPETASNVEGKIPPMKIPVRFPKAGSLLVVDGFPTTALMSWQPPANTGDKTFRLFIWSKGERATHPVADTRGPFVAFPVYHPGTYGVRVETADGTAVSDAVEFHISQAL